MNKTLIAMAVAGVMAAPMAAQADATVYGKIHVSIDVGDTGGSDAPTQDASGTYWQSNSSRIGFKGSEDLGGGLKAIWQYESNAHFGSGNTTWGGRNSYLGLSGSWGKALGGRHDTPFKTTGRKFDLFGDQVGDSRNIIGTGGYDSWDMRPTNVIAYVSPNFGGGFTVSAAYVLEDATEDMNALSANAHWKSGNWLAGLAYESHDSGMNTGTADSSGIRAGLQWKPGAWKLNAFYETISDVDGFSGDDSDAYGVGAAYKMGKNVLKAQYFFSSNTDSAGTSDIDGTTMAVGWDYNMSKRSTVYLAYAATSNDANVYYCADAGGHGGEVCGQATGTAVAGDDPSVFSIGMVHKF